MWRTRRVVLSLLICSCVFMSFMFVRYNSQLTSSNGVLQLQNKHLRSKDFGDKNLNGSVQDYETKQSNGSMHVTPEEEEPEGSNVVPTVAVLNATKEGAVPTVQKAVVKATPVKKQDRPKDVHRCFVEDRQLVRSRTNRCVPLFGHMRDCLAWDSYAGRKPLPNFYLRSAVDSSDDEYRKASVAFVHMPKSGGTSVEEVLKGIPGLNATGQLQAKRVAHCSDLYHESKQLVQQKDPRQRLYYSKRTYGIHDFANPKRPFAYVTWLREPISRLVSTYYYAKRKSCFGVHRICFLYMARTASLADYLRKHPNLHFQDMDNFYVRLLQFGDFPDIDVTFEDCCGGVEVQDAYKIPKVEEKHYLIAKRNLQQNMAFIGITEDFKTSQDMLSNIFGIPIESEVHVNSNPHRYSLTDYELNELRRRNVWDLKLYDDAMQIYEQQKKMYFEKYLKVKSTSNGS
ncbi:uncharacterized protein [Ptychodera flava]|uniref:uncharacterized protein n=1 Tax=Ptychodera flava TaxID=63121 RepID=UPI00396A9600